MTSKQPLRGFMPIKQTLNNIPQVESENFKKKLLTNPKQEKNTCERPLLTYWGSIVNP